MKTFIKGSSVFIGLLAYLALSGWIIFSQDAWMGLFVGVLLVLAPLFLVIVSLTALVIGKVPAVRIQSRLGATGVLVSSSVAGILIVVLVAANSVVLFDDDREFTARDKFNWYAQLAGFMGMQQNTYEVEGEHAIYIVTEATKNKIEEIEELYPAMEAQLDRFLPAVETTEKPEIELHESASTLSVVEVGPHTAGVYSILTGRIHVHVGVEDWMQVLVHEYAHYRTHNYQIEETGGMVNSPHWLEEGFAQMISADLYFIDVENLKGISLSEASNSELQKKNLRDGLDVYTYGQIITTELSHTVPLAQFQNWFLEKDAGVIEQEIRTIYDVDDATETQVALLNAFEQSVDTHTNALLNLNKITANEWKTAWLNFKEANYFQMHPDFLELLYNKALNELNFIEAEEILNEWESIHLFATTTEKQQKLSRLLAGKGDLEGAITQLEQSLESQNLEERDEVAEMDLHLYKLLLEDPFHPEALQIINDRILYLDGTEEWLRMIQENRT